MSMPPGGGAAAAGAGAGVDASMLIGAMLPVTGCCHDVLGRLGSDPPAPSPARFLALDMVGAESEEEGVEAVEGCVSVPRHCHTQRSSKRVRRPARSIRGLHFSSLDPATAPRGGPEALSTCNTTTTPSLQRSLQPAWMGYTSSNTPHR